MIFLTSCNINTKNQKQNGTLPKYENNKINVEGRGQNGSTGKIVFLGKNNEIKIKEENVRDNSINSQNLLIISGDNNKIELNLSDIQDNSVGSHDSTVIVGSRNLIKMNQQRIVDNSIASDENKIIFSNGRVINMTETDLLDDEAFSKLEYALIADDTLQIETYDKAERIYKNKAKNGNPKSQFLLAKVYEFKGKYVEAEKLLQLSAEQDYVDSMLHLADLYCYGNEGIKIDKIKALILYKKASKLGNEYAKNMVKWLE